MKKKGERPREKFLKPFANKQTELVRRTRCTLDVGRWTLIYFNAQRSMFNARLALRASHVVPIEELTGELVCAAS